MSKKNSMHIKGYFDYVVPPLSISEDEYSPRYHFFLLLKS